MTTSDLYRVAIAAQELGVKRQTLQSAIERGEVPVEETGCGLPLVKLSDVRRWSKADRKRGRPPAKSQ